MSNYQGNYIGNPPTLTIRSAAGVWSIYDQGYNKRKGQWPDIGLSPKLISISGSTGDDYTSGAVAIHPTTSEIVATYNGLVLHFDETLSLQSVRQATNTGYWWQFGVTGHSAVGFSTSSSSTIFLGINNFATEAQAAYGAGYCIYDLNNASAQSNVLAQSGNPVNTCGVLVNHNPDSLYYGYKYVMTSIGSQRGGSGGLTAFNSSNQALWGRSGFTQGTRDSAGPEGGMYDARIQSDDSLSLGYNGYWSNPTPGYPRWIEMTGGGTVRKAYYGTSRQAIYGAVIPNTTNVILNDGSYITKVNTSNQIVWQYSRPSNGGYRMFFHPSSGLLYTYETAHITCYSGISATEDTPVIEWRLSFSNLNINSVIPDNSAGLLVSGYGSASGFGLNDVYLITVAPDGVMSGTVYGVAATRSTPSMTSQVTPAVSFFGTFGTNVANATLVTHPTSQFTTPSWQNATSNFT